MVVVSRLSPTHPSLTPDDFVQVHKWWTRDAKVAMLEGLSVLELCLVSGIMCGAAELPRRLHLKPHL